MDVYCRARLMASLAKKVDEQIETVSQQIDCAAAEPTQAAVLFRSPPYRVGEVLL